MLEVPNVDRQSRRRHQTRREILDAAWEVVREHGLTALTLRDVADRVGMRAPSLYSHFDSKHAIYDAMFEQAWRDFLDQARRERQSLPAEPRARLTAIALNYFDYAVADLARHQLMAVSVIPGFRPTEQAYAAAREAYALLMEELRDMGIAAQDTADIYTAIVGGLVNQQLANDPGGDRWRRLVPRVIGMFADDLGLPGAAGTTSSANGTSQKEDR